jgi:hypothetical protein
LLPVIEEIENKFGAAHPDPAHINRAAKVGHNGRSKPISAVWPIPGDPDRRSAIS